MTTARGSCCHRPARAGRSVGSLLLFALKTDLSSAGIAGIARKTPQRHHHEIGARTPKTSGTRQHSARHTPIIRDHRRPPRQSRHTYPRSLHEEPHATTGHCCGRGPTARPRAAPAAGGRPAARPPTAPAARGCLRRARLPRRRPRGRLRRASIPRRRPRGRLRRVRLPRPRLRGRPRLRWRSDPGNDSLARPACRYSFDRLEYP